MKPSPRLIQVARLLWIAWAVILWNVIFDQTLVVTARRYLAAAVRASNAGDPYVRIDDWMVPAKRRGFWLASGVSGAVLVGGLVLIARAKRSSDVTT